MHKFYLTFVTILLGVMPVCAQTPEAKWTMDFPDDKFTADAALDLRYLNEEVAGQNGFIQLSADGKSFATANGEPVRFWAMNGASISKDQTDAELAYYARFLAKMGVNIVRFHGNIQPKKETPNINEPNMDEINAIWRTVAAMKKEGIYTVISPFWGGYMDPVPAAWGLGEYTGAGDLWGLMFFDETLKTAYKEWVRVLYTQVNPYTGVALKDEPAVALIQIKNEDSVLFWTMENIKPNHRATVERTFHAWLVSKYGTMQGAYNAWSNEQVSGDNAAGGRMALYGIWEFTLDAKQHQGAGKSARVSDQLEFLTRHQQNFYTGIYNHYKSLGCKQLINGNNWRPADASVMFDAERWSNASVDVMAVNRYHDPGHQGENNGWRIDPGHTYVGESVLKNPTQFPINIKQVDNKPFLVTESGWNLPHKYQAEGPFLIAAYMSLTGIDGFFWFSATSHKIDPSPYYPWFNLGPGGDQKAMSRWTASVPGQLSLFPANALLYRKGYINPGTTVVHEERTLASIWKRELPIITEEAGFDPNRDNWDNAANPRETKVAPVAYLAGAVEVKYGGDPANDVVAPGLGSQLDFANKTVTSTTGQLKWDYGKGICTMNAPKAQGVAGFLSTTPAVELADVTITSKNHYAAVNVVSMDDKPLSNSEQILVQVGTVYRPTGWVEKPVKVTINKQEKDGFEIVNTGRMPWQGQVTNVKLKIKNTLVKSAFVLDQAGYGKREIYVERNADHINLTLPENTMYLVLKTTEPTITGVHAEKLPAVKLYPNPSQGPVMLDIPSHVNQLQIFDHLGRLVHTEKDIKPGQNQVILYNLPNGVYYVNFNHLQYKKSSFKLLVQH